MDYPAVSRPAIESFFNAQKYSVSRAFESMEYLVLAAIAFSVPLLLGHEQLLVGTVVNSMLIVAAINTRGWKKILLLVTLPSISVLLSGMIFGPQSAALLYLIPFIWIGNASLVFLFRALFVAKKKNYFLTLLAGAGIKALFLFSIAFALVYFSVIPVVFLAAMGALQLLTAIAGGVLAYPVNLAYKKFAAE